MATVTGWSPFGVSLDITATGGTVTRTSATSYTVAINASWAVHYSGAKTNYGMTASSGGKSATLNPFGTKAGSGSGSFTGTYSISGSGSTTATITVTFKNFAEDWQGNVTSSATKTVSFTVTVPAWTSYTVSYNANGGSGAPGSQTKWKDQTLVLSSTKPTRTGHSFSKWNTASGGTGTSYNPGANYTANASATLYAQWTANTYTVKYNANGGSGAPANQTKTYGKTLTLSSTKPTRTNYTFKGWGTSATATTVSYAAGGSYTNNSAITLYAIWELAYIKPRVTNFSVARCDSSGTVSDSGTYAKVSFDWETDKTITAVTVTYKASEASSYGNASSPSVSGTSGTVNHVFGGGALSSESSYDIKVAIADGSGTTYETVKYGTIASLSLPIDFTPTGDGCGIGMPATDSGILNIAHETYLNGGLGMVKLLAETDLNDVKTANFYSCLAVSNYDNAPPFKSTATFLLEVYYPGQAAQVVQRAVACDTSGYYVAVRNHYASSGWGDWNTCIRGTADSGSWYQGRDIALLASTNSPTASNVYHALTSIKTQSGSWTTGTYGNKYYLTWVTDSNYNNNSNSYVHGFIVNTNGDIVLVGDLTTTTDVNARHMYVSQASGDRYFTAQTDDYDISFGVGSGGTNRGIYDHTNSHWMIYSDASNTILNTIGAFKFNADTDSSTRPKAVYLGNSGSGHPLFRPESDGYGYVGGSNYKWAAIYASNGTIQTSDRNQKENILDIDSRYEELFSRLRPVTYELKGSNHDRVHIGYIAQEVKEAMDELGITAEEFAGYCEDVKVEYDEETGEEIKVLDENGEPIKLYSLRYTEFIALNTRMIQKQQDKINDLESRLAKLEALLNVD